MKTIILSLVAVVSVWLADPAQAVKVGQKAPDFSLTDINGKVHKLSDYAGKYVVLEWTNYGCPFVQKFYNSGTMQKLQKEWTAKGVVWLSICSSGPGQQGNMSPAEWQTAVAARKVAATAVLPDPDGTVGHLFDAKTTPDMFVIRTDGVLIYSGAIDSIRSTDLADIAKAQNYVSAALTESMAGKSVSLQYSKSYGCDVHYKD
ncbi:MAG: redoxin domain-containing protein [Verrucomicrobiales bacterium]|jgi:peroxiredoxin|nr:redoxin domain-containing protein [Verrucomicrobiales bacterium]